MYNIEEVKKRFIEYLSDKLNATNSLSDDEINDIWKLFQQREAFKVVEENTFKAAMQSTSGIDFSTDLIKSRQNRIDADTALYEYVSSLNTKGRGL